MNIFSRVGGLKPGRSLFDLSYSKLFDCHAGSLIPVMCDEVVPGDYFDIGNECIVRLQPLVAPMLHGINIVVHYFYVPYRILWDGWEEFITGGKDGTDVSVVPRWSTAAAAQKGRLWDMLGFPLGLQAFTGTDRPLAFPCRAYFKIWNDYYRDENFQTEIDITALDNVDHDLRYRDWRKDYFTSALPWTQRGTAPVFPISGTSHAVFPADLGVSYPAVDATGGSFAMLMGQTNKQPFDANTKTILEKGKVTKTLLDNNTVDLGSALTFTVNDLRLNVQIQKFMERNARAGVRYTEFLQEHFGVHPRDERLQRPEYIGGSKQPLIVSEVLKTSQDGSRPQGNLAGHGLSASMAQVARYHVKEFGLIMGIMSIQPEPVYNSQGFDRQWLRRSRYDFYFPEFAHLSEQAIENEEIYATGVEADDRGIWGYQGRFDEMRVKRSGTCNNMRDTLNYWHLARTFAVKPDLGDLFLQNVGTNSDMTRIFADQNSPGYIVHFANKIRAYRPLPIMSEPGLMDHF